MDKKGEATTCECEDVEALLRENFHKQLRTPALPRKCEGYGKARHGDNRCSTLDTRHLSNEGAQCIARTWVYE